MSLQVFNIIQIIILNIFFLIAFYTDIKSFKIYNKFNLIMLITRIISLIIGHILFSSYYSTTYIIHSFFGAFVIFIIFLIPAFIFNKPMGGDIKFVSNVSLYFDLKTNFIIMFLGILLNLAFRFILNFTKDKKEINLILFNKYLSERKLPLVPFLYIGYIIYNIFLIIH